MEGVKRVGGYCSDDRKSFAYRTAPRMVILLGLGRSQTHRQAPGATLQRALPLSCHAGHALKVREHGSPTRIIV